ncbi:SigE family RNA polymerase sigma factor [Actinomadura craniellae]|uniref:SigE family RNA polymerase sigma factor n=1 Tax=Actinomadura craniellae TaxID=2231787 RepID=UPI0018F232BA|nr:SigE family RNA polymerase sigma factor [Actinomadura craniellae]
MTGRSHADYLEFASARGPHLFRTAFLLTGDRHLAEDLVQETLGKLFRSWRRVRDVDNPAAYADTVLVRTFLSYRRRRSSGERPAAVLPDVPDTADPISGAALRLTLLDGLARLPVQDRAVLVLRYWEDRSVEETAQAMRVSPGAVRNRSARALDRLRGVLGDHSPDLIRRRLG